MYALVFAVIAAFYGIGYAVSVFLRNDGWLGSIKPVNIAASLLIVLTAFLLHTPLLDPISMSADDQFNRLVSGKIDAKDFDYGNLRFQLGREGYARLKELSQVQNHPQAEFIRAEAEKALKGERYSYIGAKYRAKGKAEDLKAAELKVEDLQVINLSGKLPEGLFDSIRKDLPFDTISRCSRQKDCVVFSRNMDADTEDEYLFVPSDAFEGIYLFDKNDGKTWCCPGKMKTNFHTWGVERKALIEAIKDSSLKAAPPKYMDLKSPNWEFTLRQ